MGTIFVAADPLGDGLRRGVVEHLQQNTQLTVVDLGVFDKYYEAAHKVCCEVTFINLWW
jgi:ribose 5-phosphate isomerase RpiB